MLQFSSGVQKEVLEARIKSRDTLNKLEVANLAVTASQTEQQRIANQQKADLLAIEARRLEISRNFAAFEEIAGKIGSQNSEKAFVQELRLVSNGDGPTEWTLGAFYMDQEASAAQGTFSCQLSLRVPISMQTS